MYKVGDTGFLLKSGDYGVNISYIKVSLKIIKIIQIKNKIDLVVQNTYPFNHINQQTCPSDEFIPCSLDVPIVKLLFGEENVHKKP